MIYPNASYWDNTQYDSGETYSTFRTLWQRKVSDFWVTVRPVKDQKIEIRLNPAKGCNIFVNEDIAEVFRCLERYSQTTPDPAQLIVSIHECLNAALQKKKEYKRSLPCDHGVKGNCLFGQPGGSFGVPSYGEFRAGGDTMCIVWEDPSSNSL
jgi:hypothetical protein